MREESRDYSRSRDGSDVTTKKREALVKSISKTPATVYSKMPSAEFDAMDGEMADMELKICK